ncbi:hypothetical protein FB451DRAFT_1100384 [Mycena latifolia]|nr:hypothetical protein FB451DRAFT_1100384 [Mycena latifolia]
MTSRSNDTKRVAPLVPPSPPVMFSITFNKSALSRVVQRRVLPATSVSLRGTPGSTRYSSTRHDNDPEVLEREKQRNLSNSQHKTSTPHEHAPGWNEHLASDSEATVKADRSDHSSPEQLQDATVDYTHSRHHGDEQPHSEDGKEHMEGPLSSAGPGEAKPDEKVKRTFSETRT